MDNPYVALQSVIDYGSI